MIGRSVSLSELEDYLKTAAPSRTIDRVIIHHFWKPKAADWRGLATVQSVCNYHVKGNGWSDIGYHLIVGPDKSLWLARPMEQAGAHTVGQNQRSVGIAYAADFDAEAPKQNGYYAGVEACAAVLRRFGLNEDDVFFHRDFAPKSCPGLKMDREEFRRDVAGILHGEKEDQYVRLKIDDKLVVGSCITIDSSGKACGRIGPIAAVLNLPCSNPDEVVGVRKYLTSVGVEIPSGGWHPEQGPNGTIYAYKKSGDPK